MSNVSLKGKRILALAVAAVLALVTVFAVASHAPGAAAADEVEATSWATLSDMVKNAPDGEERVIKLTPAEGEAIAYDGTTIEIPSGKNIKIVADEATTIYRKNGASSLDSMFTVKGELTIGNNVTLSGKTATCGEPAEGTIAPLVFAKEVDDTDANPVTTIKVEGMQKYLDNSGGEDWSLVDTPRKWKLTAADDSELTFNDVKDGGKLFQLDEWMTSWDSGNVTVQGSASGTRDTWFELDSNGFIQQYIGNDASHPDTGHPDYGHLFITTNDKVRNEKSGETGSKLQLVQAYPQKTVYYAEGYESDTKDSVADANSIANSHKVASGYKVTATNNYAGGATTELLIPSDYSFVDYGTGAVVANPEVGQKYALSKDNGASVVFWNGEYFESVSFAEANGTYNWLFPKDSNNGWIMYVEYTEAISGGDGSGNGGCTPDQGCDTDTVTVTGDKFNGAVNAEKGYFVQVNGGTLNIEEGAELRDFITDGTVTYAAPVVAKGAGSKVNMTGGKITHNSVGYTAENDKSGWQANAIGKLDEDKIDGRFEEKPNSLLYQWANTETAGAMILTEGAEGVIDGATAEISGNRGDTGAIVVQGKADQRANTVNGDATASSLKLQNGKIDNNVGVHHAGGIYIYNGADVQMGDMAEDGTYTGDFKIINNFAWMYGGGVWASEEVYGSNLWTVPEGEQKMLPVGHASFTMYSGEISGNMASYWGGGLEVMSDHVALMGGKLTNNYARVLGGGAYVEGDGSGRMYNLFIAKGCVTKNHAVAANNNETSAPLYRTLNTATGCGFSNAMDGAPAGDVSDRGFGYAGYYGNGGGVWLCSFGGNTTFNIPSDQVLVWGNDAANDGQDLVVRPLRGGATNGIILNSLGTQKFKDQNGTEYSSADNGRVIVGPIHAQAVGTEGQCSADTGVEISGNVASNGGGIAANGNVVFGENAETAQPVTTIKITKKWADEVPEADRVPVTFRLYAEVNGQRIELPGYEATVNGVPDTLAGSQEEQGQPNKYSENDAAWESEEWVAEMGLPLSVKVGNETIPLFTFDVNGDTEVNAEGNLVNTEDDLDPSKTTDLVKIYQLIKAGTLTKENARISDWKLIVEETMNGEVQTETVDLGSGVLESLEAVSEEVSELKDMNNRVVGKLTTYQVGMGFASTIGNDKEPEAEKYVNQDVHADLETFDKEFTYDVMAYVPMDATEFTITDPLEKALEFADKDGKPTTKPLDAIQSITVKNHNDHSTSVKAAADDTIDKAKATTKIENNTLTVTLTDAAEVAKAQGKWVQLTFNARIKDEYRSLDALKAAGWAEKTDNKQGDPLSQAGMTGQQKRVQQLEAVIDDKVSLYNEDSDHAYAKAGENYYELNLRGDGEWYCLGIDGNLSTFTQVTPEEGETFSGLDKEKDSLGVDFVGTLTARARADAGSEPERPEPAEELSPNWPVLSDDEHEGVKNQATYNVKFGNNSTSSHKTNTVTVEPETTTVSATKAWQDENGQAADWPTGAGAPASVTVNVYGADANKPVDTLTITKGEDGKATVETSKALPKLSNVTYTVEEVAIPSYTQVGEATGSGTEDDPYVFTNKKNGGPRIEKYVNLDVHSNLVEFDKTIKYDILAYVPADADEIVIKDSLVKALEFADGAGDLAKAAVATTDEAKAVTAVVAKKSNDHTVGSTVAGADENNAGSPLGGAAVTKISGQDLTVTVADATAYRGQWIQVTFWAKYTEDTIKAAEVGDSDTITGNGAVLGGVETHTGTTNQASYDIRVGNDWTRDVKSNTVTVEPETETIEVEKQWKNADGSTTWPAGVPEVNVNVLNGTTVVDTIKLTAEKPKNISKELPKLIGVTYTLDEVAVSGYVTTVDGNVVTNTQDAPKVEKYVNLDVHQDLVEYDRPIRYDIMAYVPSDATKATISDSLVKALEFADGTIGADKAAVASTDKTKVVTSIVRKDTNDSTVNSAVAATDGVAVEGAVIDIEGNNLVVKIEDAAAAGVQGKWVQVTFWAKYTQAVIDAVNIGDVVAVEDNGAVLGGDEKHTGTANTGKFSVFVGNEWTSEIDTNTVTVIPEAVKLEAAKQWKNADGADAAWPAGVETVTIKVLANDQDTGKSIVLDKDNVSGSITLPKLMGVTYTLDEVSVPGYTTTRDGITFINTQNKPDEPTPEQPEIEKYINKDVHQDITLGDTFTYDIIAKVTADADKVVITDTLNDVLAFADGAQTQVAVADLGAADNHKTDGVFTGANADAMVSFADVKEVAAVASIEGQTLTVTIDDATPHRGNWVRVSFLAKVADGKQLADVQAAYANISATAVEDRATPNTGNAPVVSSGDHQGVPNKASYEIYLKHIVVDENGNPVLDEEGNEKTELDEKPTYSDESNTVTVRPEEPEGPKKFDVTISKVDITSNNELPGAEIQILDSEGNVVESWISGSEPHVTKLPAGTYTLKEVAAPKGYEVVTEVKFTVDENGNVTVDAAQEITGGTVTVLDTDHLVLADSATDTLTAEASVATKVWDDGGNAKDRKAVTFQLYYSLDGENWTKFEGKTATITGPNPTDGEWKTSFAGLPAKIDGKDAFYMVEEVNAADFEGLYTPGNDATATSFGGNGMTATNHPFKPSTVVNISKQAVGGGAELPGATLQVIDAEGKVILEFVSGTEPTSFELPAGVYTLREITAPNGFEVAEDMTFRVNVDGTVECLQNGQWVDAADHIVMFDAPKEEETITPNPNPETPRTSRNTTPTVASRTSTSATPTVSRTVTGTASAQTSDDARMLIAALAGVAVLGLAGGGYSLYRRRRDND